MALGNDRKPDCLLCIECADAKTNGLRGDKSNIAKVKRHANGKTQYDKRQRDGSKLKSRTQWPKGRKLEGRKFPKRTRSSEPET